MHKASGQTSVNAVKPQPTIKGWGADKKESGGKSSENAEYHLQLLQRQTDLLRAQITGNVQLAHAAQLELDIRKAIEPAVKAGNVALVASKSRLRCGSTSN